MIGRPLWTFDELPSTQTTAFRLAELGAPHGTVVTADFQSAGRGRADRAWTAPAGSSLMFSVLIRPEVSVPNLGPVSLLVGDAVAGVIARLVDVPVQIKWPNDILIDGRKVCGILVQSRSAPDPVAVIGIGINLTTPPDALLPTATALDQHSPHPVDRRRVLRELLDALDHAFRAFDGTLSGSTRFRINARLAWRNDDAVIEDGGRMIPVRIIGVLASGALRVTQGGQVRDVVAGELTRGPRPVHRRPASG